MIGIYEDSFGDYIKEHLGDYKITANNIVCKCPFCEYDKKDDGHNHLYISLDKPIFNCFKAECPGRSGTINKFIKQLTGTQLRNTFIDSGELAKLQNYKKLNCKSSDIKLNKKFILPSINIDEFGDKENYLRSRLQYAPFDMRNIHGLIFDVNQFVALNNLMDSLNKSDMKMLSFLQNNFIGFITENHTTVVFRNIDTKSDFRYYKISLQKNDLLDYYKITHNKLDSNLIVIGEGIFDIFNDHIFDYLGYRDSAFAYYCALSNSFEALIQSVAFYDNIYYPQVIILSDNNVSIKYYKKLKRKLKNICSNIEIYYNGNGSDFGDPFCSPEKILI